MTVSFRREFYIVEEAQEISAIYYSPVSILRSIPTENKYSCYKWFKEAASGTYQYRCRRAASWHRKRCSPRSC